MTARGTDLSSDATLRDDLLMAANLIVRGLYDRVRSGELTLGVKNLKAVLEIEEAFGRSREDDLAYIERVNEFGLYLHIVKGILTDEQFAELETEMSRHPVLHRLKLRADEQERAYYEQVRAKLIAEREQERQGETP